MQFLISFFCINSTPSKIAVEKVENPPKNPVIAHKDNPRKGTKSYIKHCEANITAPITKEANAFIISVAIGKLRFQIFEIPRVTAHLHTAPSPPHTHGISIGKIQVSTISPPRKSYYSHQYFPCVLS